MKYYLTSNPFMETGNELNPQNHLVENLKRDIRDGSAALFICSDPEAFGLTELFGYQARDCFLNSGIRFSSYTILDSRNADKAKELVESAKVIILAGGHVPTQNAFFEKIRLKELLSSGEQIVIGISAGAMNSAQTVYAQPELEGEAISKNYKRFIGGLGITHKMLIPHYQETKAAELDGKKLFEEITYPDSVGRQFYCIVDGAYLYGDETEEILYGEAYLIEDGQLTLLQNGGQKTVLKR